MRQRGEIKSKILEAFKNYPNKPNRCIAEDIGCSHVYVRAIALKQGRFTQRVGEKKSKILDEFKNYPNKPNRCVAEDIGCSHDYVRAVARKQGRSTRRVGEQQFSVLIFDRLKENPNQSYIELAKSLGCGKSLVSKVAMNNLGIRKYAPHGSGPSRSSRAKCGQKDTVPHNPTTLAPAHIVPAE